MLHIFSPCDIATNQGISPLRPQSLPTCLMETTIYFWLNPNPFETLQCSSVSQGVWTVIPCSWYWKVGQYMWQYWTAHIWHSYTDSLHKLFLQQMCRQYKTFPTPPLIHTQLSAEWGSRHHDDAMGVPSETTIPPPPLSLPPPSPPPPPPPPHVMKRFAVLMTKVPDEPLGESCITTCHSHQPLISVLFSSSSCSPASSSIFSSFSALSSSSSRSSFSSMWWRGLMLWWVATVPDSTLGESHRWYYMWLTPTKWSLFWLPPLTPPPTLSSAL